MYRRKFSWSVPERALVSFCFYVVGALCFSSSASAEGLFEVSGTRWLRAADAPAEWAPASAMRTESHDDAVRVLVFEFPEIRADEVLTREGAFTRLSIPGAGVSGGAGAPERPVYRHLIPIDAEESFQYSIAVEHAETYDLRDFNLPVLAMPVRRPIRKVPGALEAFEIELDATRYVPDPNQEIVRATDLGMVRNQRQILLEVFPITYDLRSGTVTVRHRIEVQIEDSGPTEAIRLTKGGDVEDRRLLIIVDDGLVDSLDDYVAHRQASGWMVELVPVSVAGSTPGVIRDHIRARYIRQDLRPSHLLLVGDSDTIPVWPGQGAYTPDTDLYYACMYGPDDWLPDMAYGRLPARTTSQLSNMFQRIIRHETTVSTNQPFVARAAFAASSDNYTVTEGTHNAVISRHMDPRAYDSGRLFSYTFGASRAQVSQSVNNGLGLMTYSGHAIASRWQDPRFDIADVHALTNAMRNPFIMSFACLSGAFSSLDESFAEAWLRVPDETGALAVFASTEDAYWEEDDVLQRAMYEAIFEDIERPLGEIVIDAKQRYLAYYGPGHETLQYFEQYHLLGDPTMPLVVLDGFSEGDAVNAQRQLPAHCLYPEDTVHVSVHVTVSDSPPSALILKEELPPGWGVTNARWNGNPMAPSFQSGEYRWLFMGGVESGILTYETNATGNTGDIFNITGSLVYGSPGVTVATVGDQQIRMCSFIDTDGDGIPDWWEELYFGGPTMWTPK